MKSPLLILPALGDQQMHVGVVIDSFAEGVDNADDPWHQIFSGHNQVKKYNYY
jgi:hypothetical protein